MLEVTHNGTLDNKAKAIIDGYKYELMAIQDTLDIISGKWNMQVMALVYSGEFSLFRVASSPA